MAKAIKFNLILDKNPVRSLEDLRDNFNIEDLLAAYRNGSLKRWLETRKLEKEAAELEKVTGDDINAALELGRIFLGEEYNKELLAGAAYSFDFRQKEAEKLKALEAAKFQRDEIIRAYHGGYEKLLDELEARGNDYSFVKPGIAELFKNYAGLYRLDDWVFYGRFIKACPLVILALLAHTGMRPLIAKQPEEIYKDLDHRALVVPRYRQSDIDAFLKKWETSRDQPEVQKIEGSTSNKKVKELGIPILMLECRDNAELNGKVVASSSLGDNYYPYEYVPLSAIALPLPNHIQTFSGETESYWKDVQPGGRQFLIIKMEEGNFLRSAGKNGEELKAEDVNGKFPILEGIDYKSNNARHQLVYMEV